ncbi:methionyl-tRNA formyltransferase [Candidatus Saccharibacteria bacterium]|nr:methionyl-tRNA formyltransferase [Candidatus Saccharibacteria bacterium]MCB9835003.1 methionyl-tRNA formyltransferase [Candidatus Nomurabacteria bacterium]
MTNSIISDKPNIIFFGTGSFSLLILQDLISYTNILAFVCQPGDQPVRSFCTNYQIPELAYQEVTDPSFINKYLEDNSIELGIVADYGRILPSSLIDAFKLGLINVHVSLLPKYRGGSPIEYQLLNREQKVGTSLMLIAPELDTGAILAQAIYPGNPLTLDNPTAHQEFATLSNQLLRSTLPKYLSGTVKAKAQDHTKASYGRLLGKSDGKIDLSKSDLEIEAQIRAFLGWPGSWLDWQGKRIILLSSSLSDQSLDLRTIDDTWLISTDRKKLFLRTKTKPLEITTLQVAGKNSMPALAFINGHLTNTLRNL